VKPFSRGSIVSACPWVLLIAMLMWTSPCYGSGLPTSDKDRDAERNLMVEDQIVRLGVRDPGVLNAMRRVPRHRFVPPEYFALAYMDGPLPIGHDQTISQASLVAMMTEALAVKKTDKVLEVGTGSGYQAAILAELADKVRSVEIVEPLARHAEHTLMELGYRNVRVRVGDGYQGWPEEAPFDAIIVTAAAKHVPPPLLKQLAVGGRLIIPVGRFFQRLELYHRTPAGDEHKTLTLVRFVPLIRQGDHED
jgi:protein-L-isoaspartate(D-aspartate) O-methyltransferase